VLGIQIRPGAGRKGSARSGFGDDVEARDALEPPCKELQKPESGRKGVCHVISKKLGTRKGAGRREEGGERVVRRGIGVSQRAPARTEEDRCPLLRPGDELVVFRDGASAAATESKRLKLPGLLEGLVDATDQVAIFYHSGEGMEIFTAYGTLLSGLAMQNGVLTNEERDTLQDFIESDAISPAFVRRVIGETGSEAIERLYLLPEEANGVEYLLRRFKGCYFRKRYPNLSLRE